MKIISFLIVASLAITSVSATPVSTQVRGPGGVPAFDQCFQWIWLADFYAGKEDMLQALRNQAECRADRLAKFGI